MAEQYYDTAPGRINKILGAMLKHAMHTECLATSGRIRTMPKKKGDTIIFRRVIPWGATDTDHNTFNRPAVIVQEHQVQEGITPEADTVEFMNVSVTPLQYACLYKYTDKTADLHEDRIPAAMVQQTGERMGLLREMLKYGALKACGNRFWAGKVAGRANVASKITVQELRRVDRVLRANHARFITRILTTTPDVDTRRVEAGYVAYCHTDLTHDLRQLGDDFTKVSNYGERKLVHRDCEEGTVEKFRFVVSPELRPYKNAGADIGATGLLSSGGAKIDVYPIIIVARNAWADLVLRGMDSMDVTHLRPGQRTKSDPLGQRGYIGSIFWNAPFIENDGWMAVLEVGVTDI